MGQGLEVKEHQLTKEHNELLHSYCKNRLTAEGLPCCMDYCGSRS